MDEKSFYLVTGASSGIGRATAIELSRNTDTIVVALARNVDALEKLRAESEGRIMPLTFDLSQQVPTALSEQLRTLGIPYLNGIVHNAGKLVNRPFEEFSVEELRSCYEVNVFAPFQMTQALLPMLSTGRISHIVNIGSVGGIQGSVKFPGLSAYSSSKGALSILTECLALELEPKRIRVNCLALGAVQTEMLANAFPGYQAPLTAQSMGQFVSWFLMNGHQYFNGKILPVALSTP